MTHPVCRAGSLPPLGEVVEYTQPRRRSIVERAPLATLLLGLGVILGLGFGGPARSGATPDVNRATVVVRVGTSPITAADILAVGSRLPPVPASGDPVADRRARIAPVVRARLLVLEAEARGLDDPTLAREVARFERERLVAEVEANEVRGRITIDAASVAEGMQRAGQTLVLSQIVTDQAAAAESLLARALAGESFAELARTRSVDQRSAADGGRLPPVTWGNLPPALEEAAYRLSPGDIAGPLALGGQFVLVRLDSVQVRAADPDSLRELVTEALSAGAFRAGQVAFLDTMKVRLHATVVAPNRDRFLDRMTAFAARVAAFDSLPPTPPGLLPAGTDRCGFTAAERALPLITYDLGKFTIGQYADYLAPEAAERVAERADRARVDRDLDQYFRHHAYADYARAQGYDGLVADQVARARERALIGRLVAAEGGTPKSGLPDEESKSERMEALITALEGRTAVVYDDSALARLPF